MAWLLRLRAQGYALTCRGCYGPPPSLRDTMPKAKPTQVIVHRIELQEKEREYLEALQTTQSIKNLAIGGAAVGVTAVGFMSYKAWKEWRLDEEGSMLDMLTKSGRDKLLNRSAEEGAGSVLKELLFDPFNLNPFW